MSSNLNEKMQARLDRWRKEVGEPPATNPVRGNTRVKSKGDYGDAMTLDEWEEEARKSQSRK